ncbi:MAG: hypothetical protein ACUVQG_11620 [Thermogutta sp.]
MKSFISAIAVFVVTSDLVFAQIPELPTAPGTYGTGLEQPAVGPLAPDATVVPGTPAASGASLPPAASANRGGASASSSHSKDIPLPPTAPLLSGPSRGGGGWVSGEAALSGGPFPGYMTGYGTGQVTAGFGAGGPVSVEKPFATFAREPSVSPYINLYRPEGTFGAAGNYYSLVRPMVQQQQVNRQLSRQISRMQSAISSGRGSAVRGGSTGGYFMNYYGFYPGLGSR